MKAIHVKMLTDIRRIVHDRTDPVAWFTCECNEAMEIGWKIRVKPGKEDLYTVTIKHDGRACGLIGFIEQDDTPAKDLAYILTVDVTNWLRVEGMEQCALHWEHLQQTVADI